MEHGLPLADLFPILALADWGVVARDLANATGPKHIKPRIADVPDGNVPILDNGHREDTGHPVPRRVAPGEAMHFIVGDRDGFANAFGRRAGLAFQARAKHADRDLGCHLARRLAAHAVDDEKDSAL